MNTTFDTSFEPNFSDEYNREDLIEFLQSQNDMQKHYAVLELSDIQNDFEAQVLVSNLVGQDGKIREAVAFKINEFMHNESFSGFFINENFFPTFLEGIMDINGNVCRNIVNMNWSSGFEQYLCKNLPESINKILKNIAELEKDEKQYKISKRNFQLYWSLEALYNCLDDIKIDEIKEIILTCGNFADYTIREKIAKILTKIDSSEFDGLKEQLKNDENYYVRRFLE